LTAMSSNIDTMEMVQYLTKKDIITEAGSLLTSLEKHTWASLISAISQSQELQLAVRDAYHRKQEHQQEEKEQQLKHTHFDNTVPSGEIDVDSDFLKNPNDDIKWQVLAGFINRSGNIASMVVICMCCVRELAIQEVQRIFVDELPNCCLLRPVVWHNGQNLVQGLLLHMTSVSEDDGCQYGPICHDCFKDLLVDNIPVHSLANGLWVGAVPDVLSILNLPERLLVALFFPAMYVIKLYPQWKGAKQWDSMSLNSGVQGNVSTYQLNSPDIARMIEGDLMPHKPAVLAAMVAITIIGPSKLPVKSLPSLLSVSRHCVKAALLFLKCENHLYRNVVISDASLSLLPEDGVEGT
jgi:hypothetical protein